MELNKIYNEDLFVTIDRMKSNNVHPNIVLTSPPYNTARTCINGNLERSMKNNEVRYDIYQEQRDEDEYIEWTRRLFNSLDKVLIENGCILYNISYGDEYPNQLWRVLADIIDNTNFTIADTIIWKKKNALPNNSSSNKLTRICEFVFVICRKDEFKTFYMNKKVLSVSETGQKYYENLFNIIDAKNNDGPCELNKATYSTELCVKLLTMYAKPNSLVYDCFMGTGTTAVACQKLGHSYIGSELSKAQCEYAEKRLNNIKNRPSKMSRLF